jgi:hypothetical protein
MCVPMGSRCVCQWVRDVCANGFAMCARMGAQMGRSCVRDVRAMCMPMGSRCAREWARRWVGVVFAMCARCVCQWVRDVRANGRADG